MPWYTRIPILTIRLDSFPWIALGLNLQLFWSRGLPASGGGCIGLMDGPVRVKNLGSVQGMYVRGLRVEEPIGVSLVLGFPILDLLL